MPYATRPQAWAPQLGTHRESRVPRQGSCPQPTRQPDPSLPDHIFFGILQTFPSTQTETNPEHLTLCSPAKRANAMLKHFKALQHITLDPRTITHITATALPDRHRRQNQQPPPPNPGIPDTTRNLQPTNQCSHHLTPPAAETGLPAASTAPPSLWRPAICPDRSPTPSSPAP